MIVLAIDTCLGACSAAVIDGERVLASVSEPMWRGHQERLGSLVAQTMKAAGVPYSALTRVGATVGPGSFTGLRVGVAFAKGLGLALDIPVVGVGTLAALAYGTPGKVIATADARRGNIYWQAFEDGEPTTQPAVGPISSVPPLYGAGQVSLVGPAVNLLAPAFPDAQLIETDAPDPVAVARLAAAAPPEPITPIYLRAPDAKLPGGIDPEVLAALHASAFDHPWPVGDILALIASGAVALAEDGGFILIRAAAGEAEILTLAVDPAARRAGLGRRLVEAAAVRAAAQGAQTLFLEVADDNEAALALYRAAGFAQTGRRKAYYKRTAPDGAAQMRDALIFARALNSA